jgi:GT2 family glycosyltransferase
MTVFWRGDQPVGHVISNNGKITGIKTDHIDAGFLAAVDRSNRSCVRPSLSCSVVICTRDRPAELSRCLASVKRQSVSAQEIIVVDNGSVDEATRNVATSAEVIYVREDRLGLDIARNTGALRASGDIVVFTDDDVIVHRRWLERLVGAFTAPEIGAVTGLVLPGELATEAQLHFETFWSFGQGYQLKDVDHQRFRAHPAAVYPAWTIGAGASMAFRRDVFRTVGLFDPRLDVGQAGCSGDSEFWYRLLSKGYTCRYTPAAVAFHFHRRTSESLSRQIYYYMRGHAAALLVQYERTRLPGNMRQAIVQMPRWYARRVLRALVRGRSPNDAYLKEEILGYLSGLLFYYRTRDQI